MIEVLKSFGRLRSKQFIEEKFSDWISSKAAKGRELNDFSLNLTLVHLHHIDLSEGELCPEFQVDL
jgi:hypothetical protein